MDRRFQLMDANRPTVSAACVRARMDRRFRRGGLCFDRQFHTCASVICFQRPPPPPRGTRTGQHIALVNCETKSDRIIERERTDGFTNRIGHRSQFMISIFWGRDSPGLYYLDILGQMNSTCALAITRYRRPTLGVLEADGI